MDVDKNAIKNKINNVKKLLPSTKFKNNMGFKLAALALALGIGGFSIVSKYEDGITLGITRDISGDQYHNAIPLFADPKGKSLLTTIRDKKLLIALDNIEAFSNPKSLHLVSVINDNNKLISGYTYQKYIAEPTRLSTDNTSFLYKVNAKNGVNLRETPEISDNKILAIPSGSILLGAKSDEQTKEKWTNIVYFNGGSINSGFVSGKHLEQLYNTNDHFDNVIRKRCGRSLPSWQCIWN